MAGAGLMNCYGHYGPCDEVVRRGRPGPVHVGGFTQPDAAACTLKPQRATRSRACADDLHMMQSCPSGYSTLPTTWTRPPVSRVERLTRLATLTPRRETTNRPLIFVPAKRVSHL